MARIEWLRADSESLVTGPDGKALFFASELYLLAYEELHIIPLYNLAPKPI